MTTTGINYETCHYGCKTVYLYIHNEESYCYAHYLAHRQDGQTRREAHPEQY